MQKRVTSSAEETIEVARELYHALGPDRLVCFFGDLGSGKTTFVKGFLLAAGGSQDQVTSPTFTYLHLYPEGILHFDLYRLKGVEQFLSLGFDEYLFSPGLKCIEWSERIASILPEDAVRITFSIQQDERRTLHIEGL